MKNLKMLAFAGLTGVVLAAGVVSPAYAWHPEVKITKYVQNQTAGGQMADANDAGSAVSTKPGDVIKYTFVVENTAKPASREYNDLHFTKLTDQLPTGVELVSDPAKRNIVEQLGVLKPGDKVTKEYILKVTSTKNGDVVLNTACVSGNSKVNDAPRSDCDPAVIKVNVPIPPKQPPKTPEPPKDIPKETPEVLPVTGPANLVVSAGAVTVLGYIGNLIRTNRRKNGQ
jgi:uncharacterized repeat protein (TIGR01451 family)